MKKTKRRARGTSGGPCGSWPLTETEKIKIRCGPDCIQYPEDFNRYELAEELEKLGVVVDVAKTEWCG